MITSEQYREALRCFPSGVTIVTIKAPDESLHGLTVSAFVSLSPEPPLIMVSIDHKASGHGLLQKEGAVFAVNVLAYDQIELSNRFAWVKDEDRFAVGMWETAVTGAPILANCLSWLDCTVYDSYEVGTHTIFVGKVEASGSPRPHTAPLVYWNRGYRQLCRPDVPPA